MNDLTVLVLFGFVGGLVIYDVAVIYAKGYKATVSWTMLSFAKAYPIVPFAMGILFGHFYFPNQLPQEPLPCVDTE